MSWEKLRLYSDLFSDTMSAVEQWNGIFRGLKEKKNSVFSYMFLRKFR